MLIDNYYVNSSQPVFHKYTEGEIFNPQDILKAALETNKAIRQLVISFKSESNMQLFDVIDKKQTGAFVGAIFIKKIVETAPYLVKNPSQTGHPDLVPSRYLDPSKKWDQQYWDQFPHGGVEVKTSCGNLKNGMTHTLTIDNPRIDHLTGIVWKGHHNEINNLLGLFWDYCEGYPKIFAAFFSNALEPTDFTYTVPKEGGGHTTNVCITKSSASKKLGQGWVFCIKEAKYSKFISRMFGIRF